MPRITLVGTNRVFLQEAKDALGGEYDIEIAETPAQAMERTQAKGKHLVLIDCSAEEPDALELIERIRVSTPSVRVIVTAPEPTKELLIKALNLKVDGFFERPGSWENLKLRIQAAFASADSDDIQIDAYRRAVVVGSESVPLTKTEFSLLMLFRQKPGVFLTRSQISDEIWPDSTVAKNNLDTHLSRLRSKIPSLKARLLCLRGEGFVYTPSGAGLGFTARTPKRR
ncbi:MAG: response regulator transcription factor [Bdellovibrionaceae bacterium]|nr:response regulator transcription factor [Pseudobdellovibrionaceae bacterium]